LGISRFVFEENIAPDNDAESCLFPEFLNAFDMCGGGIDMIRDCFLSLCERFDINDYNLRLIYFQSEWNYTIWLKHKDSWDVDELCYHFNYENRLRNVKHFWGNCAASVTEEEKIMENDYSQNDCTSLIY